MCAVGADGIDGMGGVRGAGGAIGVGDVGAMGGVGLSVRRRTHTVESLPPLRPPLRPPLQRPAALPPAGCSSPPACVQESAQDGMGRADVARSGDGVDSSVRYDQWPRLSC